MNQENQNIFVQTQDVYPYIYYLTVTLNFLQRHGFTVSLLSRGFRYFKRVTSAVFHYQSKCQRDHTIVPIPKASNIYKANLLIIIYFFNTLYNCFKRFSHNGKTIFYVLLFTNSYILTRFGDWFTRFGNWFTGEA